MLTNFFCTTFCYYGICFISERLFQAGDLYVSMFCTSISELPAIFLAVMFIDRTGRKGMMNICWLVFCIICLVIMLLHPGEISEGNQRMMDIILVFLARCSVTMLFLVVFVYFAEYYPTIIRSTAVGFGSSLGRIAGMITTVVAEDLSLVHAMLIYSILGLCSVVITLILPQDTTGLKMKDFVDRCNMEMSWFAKNFENGNKELNGDDVERLHSGIRGILQKLKAYMFSPSKKS
jgi:MFS family permease